jgi:putative DNA-invertase from lambdoid prophage Rac
MYRGMVVYGYLRVSTNKQDENNYRASILTLANDMKLGHVTFISETVSGRKDWRKRLLGQFFDKMVKGDTLILAEYSRIGRDFLQSMEFLSECRRKGVAVISTSGDIPINDNATSNLLLSINAWKSQVERENIAYRTKIGIEAHRKNGSVIGRPKKMVLDGDINNVALIRDEIKMGIKLKDICTHVGVSQPTLRKFIKEHDLQSK